MTPLLKHLRISDLELFVTAASLAHLGKAADLHSLSQSAASAAVKRIELGFGRALCLHEKKSFRLSPEGTVLLPKIEEWLRKFKETLTPDVTYPIRLATTRAIARLIVPELLPVEYIDFRLLRPDRSYSELLRHEVDIILVPASSKWDAAHSTLIGHGLFQLYCKVEECPIAPVLLPENQIEVLTLIQRWNSMHPTPIEIKARIPSWSLISDICAHSNQVGFLPDFLARQNGLHPVSWQPAPSSYQILALHLTSSLSLQNRLDTIITACCNAFIV